MRTSSLYHGITRPTETTAVELIPCFPRRGLRGITPVTYLAARALFPNWVNRDWQVLHGPMRGTHFGHPDYEREVLWVRDDYISIPGFCDLIVHAILGHAAHNGEWQAAMMEAARRAERLPAPELAREIREFALCQYGQRDWRLEEAVRVSEIDRHPARSGS